MPQGLGGERHERARRSVLCCVGFFRQWIAVAPRLCVRKLQNVQVIAVGADLTPTTILKAVRAGAVDCLDIRRDFDKELAESVAHEKALSQSTTTIGRLITVIGSSGGCGASLLAANLAVAIAQRQRRCALDLHVRGGDLQQPHVAHIETRPT